MNRRDFLMSTAAIAGTVAFANADSPAEVQPISTAERGQRIAKLQKLMQEARIDALLLEPGTSLIYFTGVRWGTSERFTGAVIPKEGDIAYITPFMEEATIRERLTLGKDVRTWHEHEDPFKQVVGILNDRGLKWNKLAVEANVRHFVTHGISQASKKLELVPGKDVVDGCRMIKSAAELALMQKANTITLAAYKETIPKVAKGMTPSDIKALMNKATIERGGSPSLTMALVGEASAYPHGSNQPQIVTDGTLVLMDCGCTLHDYQSDISRTFVVGEPTKAQRKLWNAVKEGQETALAAAQLGRTAGSVDDAVRTLYQQLGFGPEYKTPGLPHRTGHGIGMDVHEAPYIVKGNNTPLAVGMCFSNEPGLYHFGEFGVRLEDILYMTEKGPRSFTPLSESIDKPCG